MSSRRQAMLSSASSDTSSTQPLYRSYHASSVSRYRGEDQEKASTTRLRYSKDAEDEGTSHSNSSTRTAILNEAYEDRRVAIRNTSADVKKFREKWSLSDSTESTGRKTTADVDAYPMRNVTVYSSDSDVQSLDGSLGNKENDRRDNTALPSLNLSASTDHLEAKVRSLQVQMATISTERKNMQEEYQSKLDNSMRKTSELEHELMQLKVSSEKLKQENISLTQKVQNQKEELSQTEADLEDSKKRCVSLESEVGAIKNELEDAKSNEAKMASMRTMLDENESFITLLQQDKELSKERSQTALETLRREGKRVEKTTAATISSLKQEKDGLAQKLKRLTQESQETIASLEKMTSFQERTIASLRDEVVQVNAKLLERERSEELLQGKIERLTKDLCSTQKQKEKVESELHARSAQNQSNGESLVRETKKQLEESLQNVANLERALARKEKFAQSLQQEMSQLSSCLEEHLNSDRTISTLKKELKAQIHLYNEREEETKELIQRERALKDELREMRNDMEGKILIDEGELKGMDQELHSARMIIEQEDDFRGMIQQCDDVRRENEELNSLVSELRSQLNEHEERLSHVALLENTVSDLKAEKDALLSAKEMAENTASDLNAEKDALLSAKEMAENTVLDLKAEKDALLSAKEMAENTASDLNAEKDALLSAKEMAENTVSNLKAENKALLSAKETADASTKRSDEIIKVGKETIEKLQGELDSLSTAALGMKEENTSLKAKIQGELDSLSTAARKLKKENTSLKAKLDDASKRLSESEQEEAQSRRKLLSDNYSKIKKENIGLREALSDQELEVEECQGRIVSLEKTISKLKSLNNTAKEEHEDTIVGLEQEVADISRRRKELVQQHTELKKENNALQELVSDLRCQLEDKDERLAKLGNYDKSLEEIEGKLTKAVNEKNELEIKLRRNSKLLSKAEAVMAQTNAATLNAVMDALDKKGRSSKR